MALFCYDITDRYKYIIIFQMSLNLLLAHTNVFNFHRQYNRFHRIHLVQRSVFIQKIRVRRKFNESERGDGRGGRGSHHKPSVQQF